jgi:hypothetical protein
VDEARKTRVFFFKERGLVLGFRVLKLVVDV